MLRASVVRDVMSRREHDGSAKEAELGFSRLFAEAPVGIAFWIRKTLLRKPIRLCFKCFPASAKK